MSEFQQGSNTNISISSSLLVISYINSSKIIGRSSRVALQRNQVVLKKHYTIYKMDVGPEYTIGTLHITKFSPRK